MPRVLVVEDQPNLLRSLSQALAESGFDVSTAGTLNEAKDAVSGALDVVVLDLMLPDGNSLEWLPQLKTMSSPPAVLVLTARDSIGDRVRGLDAGADDYLVKPFAIDELLARVRALLRRETRPVATTTSFRDVTVDLLTRAATRGGQALDLQHRQVELLVYFMRHANSVVTRDMIARDVWKERTATWTNVIEVHVNQLRKKLDGPGLTPLLHTVRGQGYLLGDAP